MAEGSAPEMQGGEQGQGASVETPAQAADPVATSPAKQSSPYRPASPPIKEQATGGWWTLPMMCMGIGLIACSMIVGQVEENRQMAWQKNKLQLDLEYLQKQAKTNAEFLERLKTDANLVERLAQRQMKLVREGAAVLELKGADQETSSAFKLVKTPPPPAVEPYRPGESALGKLFGSARQRLYASGIGALLVAMGLISGGVKEEKR